MGTASRDVDRVAALRAGLARQARTDSLGVRRNRARCSRSFEAVRDPVSLRAGVRETRARILGESRGARGSRASAPRSERSHLASATARRPASSIRRAPSRCQLVVQRVGEVTRTGAWTHRSAAPSRTSPACRVSSRCVPTTADRSCSRAAASETNGAGLLLVTEEWLLSGVQIRNPGLTREGYDEAFGDWLGARKNDLARRGLCGRRHAPGTWTDIARFVSPDTIRAPVEAIPPTTTTRDRWTTCRRLELAARDPQVGPLKIVHCRFRAACS